MATTELTAGEFAPGGAAMVERITVEVPAATRAWQLGVSYAGGAAKPPAGPSAPVSGNAEIWGRGEWVEATGLAFGGGLGIGLPTSLHRPDGPGAHAAALLVSMRPWDAVLFDARAFAVRPFIDMRAVVAEKFVFQFRQRVDLGLNVVGSGASRTTLSATIGIGASYKVGAFNAGLEAWELYFIERDAPDPQRGFFSVAPFVCAFTARLEPCFSVSTNIERPVSPDITRVYAARASATIVFE
jgi:hypothetical protein